MESKCPRCGVIRMREPREMNALSRTTRGDVHPRVYVCSPCDTDEGLQDHFNGGATPQTEWPLDRLAYAEITSS